MPTVYTFVPSPKHVYPDHPERPARLDVLKPRLDSFPAEMIEIKPAILTQKWNESTTRNLSPRWKESAARTRLAIIDYAPTYMTPSSFDDALLAAWEFITCTRAVLRGEADNAFAIVRPPGITPSLTARWDLPVQQCRYRSAGCVGTRNGARDGH
ncbi:MAG: hypothetical protein U0X87_17640 [Anaerolineales bacterium]